LKGENLTKLVELMDHLRGPEGCPWDRDQDLESLKGLLLEEAYEVVDTVNARDFEALEDELGDLLFQVVFYCRLAEEEKHFSIDGVIERVHAKLVRRHPHVFGDQRARTADEALASWNKVKEMERQSAAKSDSSLLDGIAPTLPACLEAYELGVRASQVGFDWPETRALLDKLDEELQELETEVAAGEGKDAEKIQEEVGDLLFTAANLARFIGSDPESCLRAANQKFKRRFQLLEREVARQGRRVSDCSAQELDVLWRKIKAGDGG